MQSLSQRVDDLSRELSRPTDSSVIHMQTLRKAIGWLALGLPFALAVGEDLRDRTLPQRVADRALVETSISAYFHTGMRDVFVGILCAIAVFLLCYKGYERRDEIAAGVAGFSVLLVALFPTPETSREGPGAVRSVTLFSGAMDPDPALVGTLHFVSAAVFFVTLAVMSLFLFTKSDQPVPTPRKRHRNRVYVACGVVILACIALIVAGKLFFSDEWGRRTSFMFWLESVAVIAFGISWLVKGEVVLGDNPDAARSTSGARA